MRKEDNSPQGKIVTELLQHLHACKNNCDVFFGREDELEKMKEYITGPSQKVRQDNPNWIAASKCLEVGMS